MADGTLNGVISQNGTMRASISPEPTQVRARMTPQTQGMNANLEMARQFVAPTFFDDLADVEIDDPQDGQVPRYNSETGKWENSTTQDAVWGNIVGSLSDQTDLQSALDAKISSTEKGSNGGVATLDNTGRVPSSQLPSYVDDVIEGYLNPSDHKFYEESTYEHEITPEGGKIYVDLNTDKTYRWGGSAYAEISESIALGETQGTAYEGNKGKANADNIAAIQGKIPANASSSNKMVTASDLATKQDALTFDNVPTSGSDNPVKSGGLFSQIGDLDDLQTTDKDSIVDAINEVAGNTGAEWGAIDGDISDQTDLMDELDKKVITLTKAQYEALPAADKLDPTKVYYVPDDESEYNTNELDDTVTASDKVWSSQKVATELAKKYDENDTAETDIADDDYVPFYDTSATGKRKSLWSNIKAKLKAYFDGIYTLLTIVGTVESGTTASKAYAIGNHFIKDGYFCTATAAIAQGATLTLNTNYTRGDIADACKAKVASTGSYNDLSNKPTIPSVQFSKMQKTYSNVTLNANKEVNLGTNTVLWPSGKQLINMEILSASTGAGALRIEYDPFNRGANIWLIGAVANQSISQVVICSTYI